MHYCLWVHEVWFHYMPHPASGARAQRASCRMCCDLTRSAHNAWSQSVVFSSTPLVGCCNTTALFRAFEALKEKLNCYCLQWCLRASNLFQFHSILLKLRLRLWHNSLSASADISLWGYKQQLNWWAGPRKRKAINLVYNSSPLFL